MNKLPQRDCRGVALGLSVLLVFQLFIVTLVSTAMLANAERLDAFGNPICSGRSIGHDTGGSFGEGHSTCCNFCSSLAQLQSAAPPTDFAPHFRPVLTDGSQPWPRTLVQVVTLKHPQARPRAPPFDI